MSEISKFEFNSVYIDTSSSTEKDYALYQSIPYITVNSATDTSSMTSCSYGVADRETSLPNAASTIPDRTFTITYNMTVDNNITLTKTKTMTDVIQSFTFPSNTINSNFFSDYPEFVSEFKDKTEYLPVHLRYDNDIEHWGCIGTFKTIGYSSYSKIILTENSNIIQTNFWKKIDFPHTAATSDISKTTVNTTYNVLNNIVNSGASNSIYYTYTNGTYDNNGTQAEYTMSKNCPVTWDSTGFLNIGADYTAGFENNGNKGTYILFLNSRHPFFKFSLSDGDLFYNKEKTFSYWDFIRIFNDINVYDLTRDFTLKYGNNIKYYNGGIHNGGNLSDPINVNPYNFTVSYEKNQNQEFSDFPLKITYSYSLSGDLSYSNTKYSLTETNGSYNINRDYYFDNGNYTGGSLYMANSGSFTTEFLPNEAGIINTIFPDTTKGQFSNFSIAEYVHLLPYSFTTTSGQYSTYELGGSGTVTTTSAILSNRFETNGYTDFDTDEIITNGNKNFQRNGNFETISRYIDGSSFVYINNCNTGIPSYGSYNYEDLNQASFTGYLKLEMYNNFGGGTYTRYFPLYKPQMVITDTNQNTTHLFEANSFIKDLSFTNNIEKKYLLPVDSVVLGFGAGSPKDLNELNQVTNNTAFFTQTIINNTQDFPFFMFNNSTLLIEGTYGGIYYQTASLFPIAAFKNNDVEYFDLQISKVQPCFTFKKIKTLTVNYKQSDSTIAIASTYTFTKEEIINDNNFYVNSYKDTVTALDLVTSTTLESCTESTYNTSQTIYTSSCNTTYYTCTANYGAFTTSYEGNIANIQETTTELVPESSETICNFVGNQITYKDDIVSTTKMEYLFDCGDNTKYPTSTARFSNFNEHIVTGYYYLSVVSAIGPYISYGLYANINGMTFETIKHWYTDQTNREVFGNIDDYPLFSGSLTLADNNNTTSLTTYLNFNCLSTVPLSDASINVPALPSFLSTNWETNINYWTNITDAALKTFTANISYGEGCADSTWSSIIGTDTVFTHYRTTSQTITKFK